MATAEELFASLNSDEPHIVINSDRSITVPDELKNIAVQYDHDIETVTFDCPRYWDGNDLSEMIFNINYVRSDKHENTYVCKNVTVDSNDSNIIHFDWTISQDVTDAAGTLTFIVCVKKSYIDGVTSQIWHSQKCDTLTILPGLKCDQAIIPSESEYNGVQVDYDQNSETAADYIKNRPFYKESKVYSFPDADYSNPAYVISDDSGNPDNNIILYKISDTPIESNNFIGAIVTGHALSTPSEKESITLTEDMVNSEQDDDGNNLLVAIADTIYIFYSQYQVDETHIIEPGVYFVVNGEVNEDNVVCLDSIEITLNLKQIDESFIPPLNYASKELEQRVDTLERLANTAKSTAESAKSTAESAKSTAESAKSTANQAITNLDNTNAKLTVLAENSFDIKSMHVDNASFMFSSCGFSSSPFERFASKNFNMTFYGCKKMQYCSIYSFDEYKPTNINSMFAYCGALKKIQSSNSSVGIPCLNLEECTSAYLPFAGCTSLTNIYKITNIKISLNLGQCPLDDATVNMLLSNLKAVSDTQTLTLKSDIVKNLTEEQLSKVPSGWVIN